jgi:hypothetical protein
MVLDITPDDLADALRMDLREARKRLTGVNEKIAEMLGIEAGSVYKWTANDRTDMQWTPQRIEAVIKTTGGVHTLAYMHRLAASSAATRCGGDLRVRLSELVRETAEINTQVAADLDESDKTPGVIDAQERVQLLAMIEAVEADLASIRSQVESMDGKTALPPSETPSYVRD